TGKDYVIASDTDSVYINFEGFIQKVYKDKTPDIHTCIDFLEKLNQNVIQTYINKRLERLAKYLNGVSDKIVMKREAICSNALWVAKKRYILNVWDNEGVRKETPDIKVMGLEVKRSSTPD